MGLLSKIGKTAIGALKTFETIVQAPIKSAKTIGNQAAFNSLSNKINSDPLPKQIGRIVATGVTAAATVVGGGAIAGSKTALTVVKAAVPIAKSLIPKSTTGKIATVVAAPIVAGAVISQPAKSASAIAKAPSELVQFGSDLATFGADPSIQNAKQIVTESPLISGAVGLAIGGGILKAALPLVGTERTVNAIQAQTEAIQGITVVDKSSSFGLPATSNPNTAVMAPPTAQTQTLSNTQRKRSPSKKVIMPSIRQNVNVIVQNRNSNIGIRSSKRYLNMRNKAI